VLRAVAPIHAVAQKVMTKPVPQKMSTMLEFLIARLYSHSKSMRTRIMRPAVSQRETKFIKLGSFYCVGAQPFLDRVTLSIDGCAPTQ